jgi:PAS domain S-box-containing protein
VLLHYLSEPRKDLERRILELSALDEVSKTLRSEIDLEKLLATIQVQVTGLLNVNNFYVALIDQTDRNIWYPLAVKNGQRQNWPRRPLTDRLTDRVILESKPIIIPHHAGQQLEKIGLPAGEDAPYAWIGVPLITSEETIGCLASFSLTAEVEFSDDDLNLLNILSGQTSVAIEIALHNALLTSDITIGRDRLTTVLNSVQDGIILIEKDARITLLNEAVYHLTGLHPSEFIGKKINDLSPAAITSLGYSRTESGQLSVDDYFDRQDPQSKISFSNESLGIEKYIERTIIQVFSQSSIPAGWIILLRDITDEQRKKEARELINETLVHDLRSPLSSTISALDMIQDSVANGDPAGVVEPSIQIAQRSSQRVLLMVESILEISKMEAGSIELSLSDTNINKLLDQSITEFDAIAQQYQVSINKVIPEIIPVVRMDKEKIHRVINNLIDNALKYSPENSQITISLQLVEGDYLEFRISDRGPGIPQKYQQKIFERFVQVPGQPSRKRGSGLGLTYCRLAIEAHEGRLWIEDRSGGGSIFIFSLPIAGPENKEFVSPTNPTTGQ